MRSGGENLVVGGGRNSLADCYNKKRVKVNQNIVSMRRPPALSKKFQTLPKPFYLIFLMALL